MVVVKRVREEERGDVGRGLNKDGEKGRRKRTDGGKAEGRSRGSREVEESEREFETHISQMNEDYHV